jgi:glutamyl-tRNA synthetase
MLAARSIGGELILRIEDTDISRSDEKHERSIIEDLKWLGIRWDEFYRQKDRLDLYLKSAEKLLAKGMAYRCFCTPERLEQLKADQYARGQDSVYDNCCRGLDDKDIEEKIRSGEGYAIRYIVDKGREISFNDLIRDNISFKSDLIGDFIIIKSDGTPSYNFAVVVDDADMKISHIIRGEDHISNTARQILLYESLGESLPLFAHLSMIMGNDGSKLSKRHGSTTIGQFREMGYLPETMANYLSLLSWTPRDGEEVFTIDDIGPGFKIKDISKSPAVFDMDKLNWLSGIYIRKMNTEKLMVLLRPYLEKERIISNIVSRDSALELQVYKSIEVFKDKLKTLSDFPGLVRGLFMQKITGYNSGARKILGEETSVRVLSVLLEELADSRKIIGENKNITLQEDEERARELMKSTADRLKPENIKGKYLYMPVRAALTGEAHGPEIPKIISILGTNNCIQRLEQTLKYLK